MLNKSFDEINEDDIVDLIKNKEPERRIIEYKIELPTEKPDSKKEFLADVSSFSNASGGHLIYGMKEKEGIPVEIVGIAESNLDKQIQRLENLLRDNIEPRLQGVLIKAIPLSSGSNVIFLRIPRSWSKPHVVRYEKHWRFYSRHSAGKYPLDVGEIRSAFVEAAGLPERIRSFRDMRLGSIVAEELPIPLLPGSRVILHLIPFISFEQAINFPLNDIANNPRALTPIYSITTGQRYNFDGYLTYGGIVGNEAHGYVQIFRNGIIEAIDAGLLMVKGDGRRIPINIFENRLIDAVEKYLHAQKKMTVPAPISLMLTLVGIRGYYLGVREELDPDFDTSRVIDKDTLLLPEVIIWDYEIDLRQMLHPIFDAVWNAAGWPCSMNYNGE
ncbi:MAG: hypothetical protein A2Y53_06495 [Chloroflexi bacterium RBG_16_47_49]|nr:MAG: hypothetical protein A2Y53_06495 [Chloroflexi bacterium RBG_16_47_49]